MMLLVPPSCFLLAEGDVDNNAAMKIQTFSFSKWTMQLQNTRCHFNVWFRIECWTINYI